MRGQGTSKAGQPQRPDSQSNRRGQGEAPWGMKGCQWEGLPGKGAPAPSYSHCADVRTEAKAAKASAQGHTAGPSVLTPRSEGFCPTGA